MGSRKARPAKAKAPSPDEPPKADTDAATTEEHGSRPSSTMTREVEAITSAELIASTLATGSVPKLSAPQPAPTEPRIADELAQTIEAPSAPRTIIMEAAELELAHVGFGMTTEAELAKAANVSLDAFHAHFADKMALLRALNERFCAQAITVTNEATRSGIWDNSSPREVIEVAVRSILDVVIGRGALVKAVLSSGDEALLEGFRSVGRNITTRIVRVIDEMSATDKPGERDVAFVFLLAVSLAHHTIMIGPEWSGVDFDRNELYERAVCAVRGYLESRPRSS